MKFKITLSENSITENHDKIISFLEKIKTRKLIATYIRIEKESIFDDFKPRIDKELLKSQEERTGKGSMCLELIENFTEITIDDEGLLGHDPIGELNFWQDKKSISSITLNNGDILYFYKNGFIIRSLHKDECSEPHITMIFP